jgi:phosphoglycerate-specific signal transduction histidine kinase
MRPRADEVMQAIIATYDEHILPNVQGELPKSLALTVSNLLRHVSLRMEREAPALIEDNAELREVLGDINRYVSSLQPAPDSLQQLQGELSDAAKTAPVNGYVSLIALTEEADALRILLDTALKALQKQRSALGGSPEYKTVRNRIRDYLNNQIKRQSLWIREAFTIERR